MNVEYRGMEVLAMVTARDIKDIQALQPDEQVLVLSLVKSFINSRGKRNDAQNRLAKMREKYVTSNPMKASQRRWEESSFLLILSLKQQYLLYRKWKCINTVK